MARRAEEVNRPSVVRRRTLVFVLSLVLVTAASTSGCRYHPKPGVGDEEPEGCRSHCAHVHQRCVEGGEAKRIGLPGVTHDLCRRELEECSENCRAVTLRPSPERLRDTGEKDEQVGTALDTVFWEPEMASIRCPFGLGAVPLPQSAVSRVRRITAHEVLLDFSPDAILMVRGGRGEPSSLVEDWLSVHAQLTGTRQDSMELSLSGRATSADSWDLEYSVREGDTETSFRAGTRSAVRTGAYCRVVAVQKAGASPDRSPMRLLESFSAQ